MPTKSAFNLDARDAETLEGRVHVCARSTYDDFALPGAEKHYPPDIELEPIHTEIRLSVDVEAKSAAGTVTHTVKARRDGPRSITLNAVALEDVSVADPDGATLDWTYDGDEIAVAWEAPFAHGEERRLEVRYRVDHPAGGLYFSQPSSAYPDEPWYAATDHETERARHWLPCVDLPTVRPRLDFHLRADARFTILANGALQAEQDHGDGTKTAHWKLDWPCPSYLTCFVIGDLVRADDTAFGDIPVAYFTTGEHTPEDLLRSFGRTPRMLDWLTGRLDKPFPFPKYYQFALPGFAGAMENISLVSWNDLYVVDESLATELGHLVDAVNIHEMAHSYFGDAIVIRDYAHAWLKESWATYIEQVWWEETDGADEAMYDYFVNATAYFKEADSAYMRPIVTREFSSSWDMYDRHLYPGGACRLHTLRHELGDATFWEGVRLYVDRFLGRTVETDDFRRAMEEVSGRSLVLFFEQWLYGKGYPALKVTFKHDAKKQEGRFEIEQTQVDEEKEVPSFRLDLDLGWVIDGEMRVETVEIREAKHTFLVSMEHAPDQVRVDPGHKVLHKLDFNPGDEMLRRQLTEAADVIGRILAGRELAKTGRHKNLEAVAAAYRQEPFYGVRIQHALSLAGADSSLAAEALASIVREETNPRVMAWLFQAAGSVRHGSIRDALRERIEAGLPYYAARMALEALGAQRAAAPLDVLAAAADTPGYGGLAQSGAFLGLAQSRHDEAIPILLEKAAYGAASNRARPSAALALGSIGHVQVRRRREQITDALEDLLKDPHPRVRVAAVAGLRSLAEPGAIASLESYARPLPAQEQIGVQRAIRKIRAAQESPGKEVETELEALRGDLKDLTGVVESLRARIDKQDGGKGRKGGSGGKRKSRKGKP